MKRKTSGNPSRIYTYGIARFPREVDTVLLVELRRAHELYNNLVAIENEALKALYELDLETAKTVNTSAIDKRISDADARLGAEPSRKKELKEELATLRRLRREMIRAAVNVAACNAVKRSKYEAAKAAYNESQAFWGTKLLVTRSIEDALGALLKGRSRRRMGPKRRKKEDAALGPRQLRFKRWEREGRVGVQLQNGLAVADLFTGKSRMIQIDPVSADAYDKKNFGWAARRRACRTTLRLRIDSDEKKRPVWVTVQNVHLHREMPAGKVMWAWLRRTSLELPRWSGPEYRWELQLVVEAKSFARLHGVARHGELALDLGWRQRGDELRIALGRDSHGNELEFKLSAEIRSQLEKSNELQGLRMQYFNVARGMLVAWAATVETSAWWKERFATLADWRSPYRLSRALFAWAKNRFAGDEAGYEALNAWAKRERHLGLWGERGRAKALRRRKDEYRRAAWQIVQKYKKVILENIDLHVLAAVRDMPEGQEKLPRRARYNRFAAAPGEFAGILRSTCAREGVELEERPAAYTTLMCAECGYVEAWDKRPLEHTCGGCGITWDQDKNAAKNLLASGDAAPNPSGPLAEAVKSNEDEDKEAAE